MHDSRRSSTSARHPVSVHPSPASERLDLLCFSHLRWDFVYQRPQHLLSRAARDRRVFFWEEPVIAEQEGVTTSESEGVVVARPQLPPGLPPAESETRLRRLLRDFMAKEKIENFLAWYYTPMALGFTGDLQPAVTIYDCMDELAGFKGAPPELRAREAELFRRADAVFTGGRSLYESKRHAHGNVHCLPSSIDREHFARARAPLPDPADQRDVPHPRVGFFGVLDERLDRELLAEVAALRPAMQFVMLGPVVKIREDELPAGPNLHYLGKKTYAELPAYIANWDAAILPFALNEATAFISPTKTPEYLAAGKRVVSTPVRDVARDYGETGLVAIAGTAEAFARALDEAVHSADAQEAERWLARVDERLAAGSWDATWSRMAQVIEEVRSQTVESTLGNTSPQEEENGICTTI